MLFQSVKWPREVRREEHAGEAGQVEHGLAEHRQHEAGQDKTAEQLRPRHRHQGPEGARGSPGGGDREMQVYGEWSQNVKENNNNNNNNNTIKITKNHHNIDDKNDNSNLIRE